MPCLTNYTNRTRTRINIRKPLMLVSRRRFPLLALLCFVVTNISISASAQQNMVVEPVKASVSMLDSTREQDGLMGPVRRVHTEMSKLTPGVGKVREEPPILLEVTTYDPQGKRVWNVYYPVNTGSFKGNQEFAYDDQGHIAEMTLRDDAGRILSREAYAYEFDSFGNWTKMTSSLMVLEAGKVEYEPFEITNRMISYYYDDSVAKILKSPTTSPSLTTGAPVVEAKSNSAPRVDKSSVSVDRETTKPATPAIIEPINPLPDTNVWRDASRAKSAKNDGTQTTEDVDVSANSPVQAYQIPAVPIATPESSKSNVSGGVVNGRIIRLPKPVYPAIAISRGVSGKVVVEVTVDDKGQVVDARALTGNPLLRPSALTAARLARFEPTLLSGQPVKATRLINFDFNPK